MVNIQRLVGMLLLTQVAWAQQVADSCVGLAKTPLEKAYCQIKAADPNAVLPTLQELRRNPEKTQRLLLRRPAQQAGIELPQERPAKKTPIADPAPAHPTAPQTSTPDAPRAADSAIGHCQLRGTSIRCGVDDFRLLGNLPNNRLAQDALSVANAVTFAEYAGSARDDSQVLSYLTETYRRYIEAMLGVGLAATTMSFTKFYHTYNDTQNKGVRFGQRLGTMFEFLKKDKAAMGVQAHYNAELPESIEQCMALSETLLVCDNVQQNWVYQRGGF